MIGAGNVYDQTVDFGAPSLGFSLASVLSAFAWDVQTGAADNWTVQGAVSDEWTDI